MLILVVGFIIIMMVYLVAQQAVNFSCSLPKSQLFSVVCSWLACGIDLLFIDDYLVWSPFSSFQTLRFIKERVVVVLSL